MSELDTLLVDPSLFGGKKPEICCFPTELEYKGDDPDRWRWRAMWDREYDTNRVIGVALEAFPVVKRTPQGAWICPYAHLTNEGGEDGSSAVHYWVTEGLPTRWVSDHGGSAWAKPTRAEALRSLVVRLQRWEMHLRRAIDGFNQACQVGELLLVPAVQARKGKCANRRIHLGAGEKGNA